MTGIIEGYLGLPAYMALPAVNRLMREGPLISGVHLLYDTDRQDALVPPAQGHAGGEFHRRCNACRCRSSARRSPRIFCS